jgi:hypothetical protein
MAGTSTPRDQIIRQIRIRLGGGMINTELDQEHFNLGIEYALDRYRVRSGNAMMESFIFLDMQPGVNTYTMPQEVQEVRDIYRHGGGSTTGGSAVDPFSLAFTQNMYLFQSGAGGVGSLATYEAYKQFESMAGRMFGRDMQFTWNAATKKLFLQRNPVGIEQLLLHAYVTKSEDEILCDPYAKPWIRDYATAQCKLMLAEARSKFQSLAGPNGGITMNGDSLKAEGNEELVRLEEELKKFVEGHDGMPFIIG